MRHRQGLTSGVSYLAMPDRAPLANSSLWKKPSRALQASLWPCEL